MNLIPPSGPIPEKTFELVVKALAFTTVAVRLAAEDEPMSSEIRSMGSLLQKLVPEDQNIEALESWAMKQLMSPS